MASLSSSPLLIYYIYYFATRFPCSSPISSSSYATIITVLPYPSLLNHQDNDKYYSPLTPIYILRFIFRVRVFVFSSFYFLSSKTFHSSFNLQVCNLFHSYSPLKG